MYILRAALIYFLLDISVQLTGFLQFGSGIGLKNCLPMILGLLLGGWGVAGCIAGCALAGLLLHTPLNETALESLCILVIGLGSWFLWHLGSGTNRIHFKRAINFAKYLGLVLGFSLICGGLSFLFVEGGMFTEIVLAYTALSVLVGIPVLTMFNSAMCFDCILPPGVRQRYDVEGTITSDGMTLGEVNEKIDDLAFSKKIPMKRSLEIQNCIEELAIRILRALPEAEIQLKLNYDDVFSADLRYDGKRYNPLHTEKNEDELDIISLKLVKHRALRASFQYRMNENKIRIVI